MQYGLPAELMAYKACECNTNGLAAGGTSVTWVGLLAWYQTSLWAL